MDRWMGRGLALLLTGASLLGAGQAEADSVPDVLHYQFSGTGTSVPNLASSPPAGAGIATIMGALTQTGEDLNTLGGGYSLRGSGQPSDTDYLDTGWATDLGTGSWTISFAAKGIGTSATLFYVFGDMAASNFRCFTNGVAGPGNWILRGGGLSDVLVPGGAMAQATRTTFVYDQSASEVRAYLDGVLVNTVSQSALNVTGSGPFKVMGYSNNIGAPDGGLLDDFRVYRRALSATEVQALDRHAIAQVSGNGVDIANGDATPEASDNTDFGDALTGTPPVTRTFVVENTGTLDLAIGAVGIGGPAAAAFSVAVPPAAVVPPGMSTTFDVAFSPIVGGLNAAVVSLASNATLDNPYTFSIQGQGIGADVQISKSNFQSGLLSQVDTVYTIQVLNAGPLAVSGVRIRDTLPPGLENGAWTCQSAPASLCPNASGGPGIDETTGPLPAGALLEYTLVAFVAEPVGASVTNTATVENLAGNEIDPANNTASDTDPVLPEGVFSDGFEAVGQSLLRPRLGR